MASASKEDNRPLGPDSSVFEELAGTLKAPWETGRAQPVIARLVSEGVFDGCSVLDVGCCIGDNGQYVAQHARGATVTGCDLVERALEVARSKAAAAGLDVNYVQQDLLAPLEGPLKDAQFDVVLDSAVYHVFRPGPARDAYVANVERLVKPGGRVVMLVFSDKQAGDGGPGPQRVSKADINSSYCPPGWAVESIKDETFECRPEVFDGAAKAYLAIIRRAE